MLGPRLRSDSLPELNRAVQGWWAGTVSGSGSIVPDGAVDLMWSPGHSPWIAGPDTAPRKVAMATGSQVLGLRLRPGVAQFLLRDSVASARDAAVSLADVWPDEEISPLVDALESASSMTLRAGVLGAAASRSIPTDWAPDYALVQSLQQIHTGQPVEVAGLGARQLRRRFTQAMGYGPAFYRRIVRLERFTKLVADSPQRTNAEVAAEAGYFDEAHLSRDATALTGSTPGQLRAD